jgi:hypothetical protein
MQKIKFRIVFWDVLPCKIIVDLHILEDNSELHTRRRENFKSRMCRKFEHFFLFSNILFYSLMALVLMLFLELNIIARC